MPLQTTDEIIVKAEIRAALFQRAFEELAMEMARRDFRALDAAAARIRPMLDAFTIGRFRPPESSTATGEEVRKFQQLGHQEAIDAFDMSVKRIGRRIRP